jgi:hypothetical protein
MPNDRGDRETGPPAVVLSGGRLTAGVVRIGETVRRPGSGASPFTATFLSHLARAGFDGAPEHLGRDELGRDILTFLPGVFRDGRPVAFIDLDFAAVGDPLEDVGYMAWSWCISSKPSRGDAAGQARQVRVLADAYGLSAGQRRPLLGAIEQRFVRNERFCVERGKHGPPVVSGPSPAEVWEWTLREKAFVTLFRRVFAAALA